MIVESGFVGALTINYRVHELGNGTVFGVMNDVNISAMLLDAVNEKRQSRI